MVDHTRAAGHYEDGLVTFHGAGTHARGPFRCSECGYGVAVTGPLPACPMCAGTSWEPEQRPAFGRAGEAAERSSR